MGSINLKLNKNIKKMTIEINIIGTKEQRDKIIKNMISLPYDYDLFEIENKTIIFLEDWSIN